MASDRIVLDGIQVPARLGVTKAERDLRRPVLIDLRLALDLAPAGQSDRIADTIDYAAIHDVVEKVASEGDYRLVEALAERIAARLLETFPVERCTVTVRKQAPVGGAVRYAGVRVVRGRGGD